MALVGSQDAANMPKVKGENSSSAISEFHCWSKVNQFESETYNQSNDLDQMKKYFIYTELPKVKLHEHRVSSCIVGNLIRFRFLLQLPENEADVLKMGAIKFFKPPVVNFAVIHRPFINDSEAEGPIPKDDRKSPMINYKEDVEDDSEDMTEEIKNFARDPSIRSKSFEDDDVKKNMEKIQESSRQDGKEASSSSGSTSSHSKESLEALDSQPEASRAPPSQSPQSSEVAAKSPDQRALDDEDDGRNRDGNEDFSDAQECNYTDYEDEGERGRMSQTLTTRSPSRDEDELTVGREQLDDNEEAMDEQEEGKSSSPRDLEQEGKSGKSPESSSFRAGLGEAQSDVQMSLTTEMSVSAEQSGAEPFRSPGRFRTESFSLNTQSLRRSPDSEGELGGRRLRSPSRTRDEGEDWAKRHKTKTSDSQSTSLLFSAGAPADSLEGDAAGEVRGQAMDSERQIVDLTRSDGMNLVTNVESQMEQRKTKTKRIKPKKYFLYCEIPIVRLNEHRVSSIVSSDTIHTHFLLKQPLDERKRLRLRPIKRYRRPRVNFAVIHRSLLVDELAEGPIPRSPNVHSPMISEDNKDYDDDEDDDDFFGEENLAEPKLLIARDEEKVNVTKYELQMHSQDLPDTNNANNMRAFIGFTTGVAPQSKYKLTSQWLLVNDDDGRLWPELVVSKADN